MPSIESLIVGSEKLTTIFGRWPSFHDAEVLDLNFWRGDVRPDDDIYKFPVLTLKIHHWELTSEVNPQGFLVLRHHTLTTLKFHDIEDFEMAGFNHQNSMMELVISNEERSQGPSPFAVRIEPAFGMVASFKCYRIEIVDAVACSEDGAALPGSAH